MATLLDGKIMIEGLVKIVQSFAHVGECKFFLTHFIGFTNSEDTSQ